MTMPHLMNCPHSEDWCLACVKEMHDEFESEVERLRARVKELEGLKSLIEEYGWVMFDAGSSELEADARSHKEVAIKAKAKIDAILSGNTEATVSE